LLKKLKLCFFWYGSCLLSCQ